MEAVAPQTLSAVGTRKHATPEQELWLAVIKRAFQDAAWKPEGTEKVRNYMDNHNERATSRVWLRGNSPDFVLVCQFADMDPGYVRHLARKRFGDLLDKTQFQINFSRTKEILRYRGVENVVYRS
jgi:hypothetical protein